MVENFDGQTHRQGLFTKMSDGTTQNSLPVYANSDASQYLWMIGSYWVVGDEHNSGSIAIKNAVSRCACFKISVDIFCRMVTIVLRMGLVGSTMMVVLLMMAGLMTVMQQFDAQIVTNIQPTQNAVCLLIVLFLITVCV